MRHQEFIDFTDLQYKEISKLKIVKFLKEIFPKDLGLFEAKNLMDTSTNGKDLLANLKKQYSKLYKNLNLIKFPYAR